MQTGRKQATRSQAPAKSKAIAPAPRSRNRANRAGSANAAESLSHYVCSITNPFCEGSRGSKWPDVSSGQTLSVPVRMRVPMLTDLNGEFCHVFTSMYSQGQLPASVEDGTISFIPDDDAWTADPYLPEFPAHSWRLVSGGVKAVSTTSAIDSSGAINMIELPPTETISNYEGQYLLSKHFPSYGTIPMRSTEAIYGIMRPNGPEARTFTELATNAARTVYTINTRDWSSLVVYVTGAKPETNVGFIDVYLNYELIISGSYGHLQTAAPPANPLAQQLSTAITRQQAIASGDDHSIDQSYMHKALTGIKSLGAFAWDNRDSIARMAGNFAMARFGYAPAIADGLRHIPNVD